MKAAGNLTVWELPSIERWTKLGGKVLIRRWTGPANLIGPDSTSGTKAFQLKSAGIDYEIETIPGQFPIISGTYGADSTQPDTVPLSDVWDMDTNDLEKDIWEHPTIVAEINKTFAPHPPLALTAQASTYAGAQALKDIKEMIAGETVEQDGRPISLDEALATAVLVGMNATVLFQWVQLALKGRTAWNVDQFVLRRTRVVAENTAIKIGETEGNIGRVFSTASLRSIENAPLRIPGFGLLPVGVWLKKRPKADPTSPGKWTLINEYWHADSAEPILYGATL